MKRLMRRPEVEATTGLPTSSLYNEIAIGKFPKPVPLSRNRVAWVEDEVQGWIEDKIARREGKERSGDVIST
jgi:prophage regulatory protein